LDGTVQGVKEIFPEKNNPSKPSLGGKQVGGAEIRFDSSHPQLHRAWKITYKPPVAGRAENIFPKPCLPNLGLSFDSGSPKSI